MAEVKLGRYELERGAIPQVCLVCGGAATQKVTRTFGWRHDGIGSRLIEMTLDVPLCTSHRRHWSRRDVFNWFVLLFLTIDMVLLIKFALIDRAFNTYAGWASLPMGALWLIVNMWLDFTNVKPTEITDNAITLTNVSERFVAQLNGVRQSLPKRDDMDFRLRGGTQAAEQQVDDGAFRAGSQ